MTDLRRPDARQERAHLGGQLFGLLRQIGRRGQHLAGRPTGWPTPLIPTVTACAAWAVCCTLRAISEVAAPCCSTAAAMAAAIALTSSMMVVMPQMASTASLVAAWI